MKKELNATDGLISLCGDYTAVFFADDDNDNHNNNNHNQHKHQHQHHTSNSNSNSNSNSSNSGNHNHNTTTTTGDSYPRCYSLLKILAALCGFYDADMNFLGSHSRSALNRFVRHFCWSEEGFGTKSRSHHFKLLLPRCSND